MVDARGSKKGICICNVQNFFPCQDTAVMCAETCVYIFAPNVNRFHTQT